MNRIIRCSKGASACACAGGTSQLVRETGPSCVSLHRALSADRNPELGTVLKVLHSPAAARCPVSKALSQSWHAACLPAWDPLGCTIIVRQGLQTSHQNLYATKLACRRKAKMSAPGKSQGPYHRGLGAFIRFVGTVLQAMHLQPVDLMNVSK